MRFLSVIGAVLFAVSAVSCAARRPYYQPQRDATISSQEERVEELERTERTETGPWEEKLK